MSFMDVITLMSGAAYPTASMILPVLDGLKDLLRVNFFVTYSSAFSMQNLATCLEMLNCVPQLS